MMSTAALPRLGACLLVVAGLGGCAVPPVADDSALQAAAASHQRWLAGVSHWRVSGRVAVKVPGDGWSATLQWQQNADEYQIQLSGPFGQGAVRIEGGGGEVVLRTAEGRVARSGSPEQLIGQELGVEVPISALRYWLLGRPDPAYPVTGLELDGSGRLRSLEQAGWQLQYEEYAAAGEGELPARLDIRRADTRARFLVSGWRLGT